MPLNSADGRGHRPEGRKSFCSGGRGCEAPTFRSGRAYHLPHFACHSSQRWKICCFERSADRRRRHN
jgi:hypothetical protein